MSRVFPQISWKDFDFTKPSVWTLILANLIPLGGVLFFGWSTFAIVVVYWTENVILGVINVLKMACAAPSSRAIERGFTSDKSPDDNEQKLKDFVVNHARGAAIGHHLSKFFFIPFFTVHYGLFCLVHGVFVFSLLGDDKGMPAGPLAAGPHFFARIQQEGLTWAVAALAASHLFSFFSNYLARGEYRQSTVPALMFQPYGRIVVLHVAILGGAFLILSLGSRVWMLVILVVGKTILDIALHLAEHRLKTNSNLEQLPSLS